MNIEKLEVGTICKNYKELCNLLGEPIKSGKSKEYQVKNWERYFKYDRDKYKFIITEIYDTPMIKEDGRKLSKNTVPYMDEMETLILDLLAQSDNGGAISLSKNKLLHSLKIINDNYKFYNRKRLKLSEITNINISNIDEFYTTTSDSFKSQLETALRRLSNQSLIFWSYSVTVCHAIPEVEYTENGEVKMKKKTIINDNGDYEVELQVSEVKGKLDFREATNKEIKIILGIERDLLDQYNCNSISELFKKGKIREFYNKINDILFERLNILYYYNSYKIIFNRDNVKKKLSDLILNETRKDLTQTELNIKVRDRIEQNANDRYSKATFQSALGNDLKGKELMRSKDDYIDNTKELNEILIKRNAKFATIHSLSKITLGESKVETFNNEIDEYVESQLPF